jgi:tRNA-splicing ligase RtcB
MKVLYNKQIQNVPIKIWSEIEKVESAAIDQLKNLSTLPFVFKHIAAMPDVHLGKGATVGSVIATKNAVVPAAVGVDIGCGMMAVKLDVDVNILKDKIKEIRSSIEASVPVGHNSNTSISKEVNSWDRWKSWDQLTATKVHRKTENELKGKAMAQLGTLGGGNHFIELCEDTQGNAWVMLHSGSRNIGKSLAEIHIANAKADMKRMFISLADPDLAYYVAGTEGYSQYMMDLMWCQEYAAKNREVMMMKVLNDISHAIGLGGAPLTKLVEVNCHHNYAALENHYGENVLITRKGAVRARQGDMGIIPGSMGTRSYIVEGLGNPESFMSCSHGAGRAMSRSEAKRTFTLEDLAKQTDGVECRKDEGVLDEIPGAYKDIDEVMENQKDLVKVVAQLKQFMCIKG